jgi:putative ABC transport system substrate-binding protein
MRRREFITLVCSAVAWPVAARAQPKFFRLGYLELGAQTDPAMQNLRRQFLLGLRDLGYVEVRQFSMEERDAGGQLDRLPALAAELVRLPVDIIAAAGEAPIRAARQATDKIPIVRQTCFCGALRSETIASSRRRSARVTFTTIPALFRRA